MGAHEDLFSGAFWSGETAVGLGLVDDLGDCRSVVTRRFGEEVDLMTIQPKKKLFSGIGGLSGSMAGVASASVVDEAAQLAVERAYLSRFGL